MKELEILDFRGERLKLTRVGGTRSLMKHQERHRSGAIGWLRAAVLGANDGLISTSSLIVVVAAAHAARESIVLSGCAGLVAGAFSMAAGEYVSVSSQADTERADLERERRELEATPGLEHAELARIDVTRGVTPELAHQVATQLMARDALGAHRCRCACSAARSLTGKAARSC